MGEELFKLTSSIGGKNNRGKPKTEEHKRKMSEQLFKRTFTRKHKR